MLLWNFCTISLIICWEWAVFLKKWIWKITTVKQRIYCMHTLFWQEESIHGVRITTFYFFVTCNPCSKREAQEWALLILHVRRGFFKKRLLWHAKKKRMFWICVCWRAQNCMKNFIFGFHFYIWSDAILNNRRRCLLWPCVWCLLSSNLYWKHFLEVFNVLAVKIWVLEKKI